MVLWQHSVMLLVASYKKFDPLQTQGCLAAVYAETQLSASLILIRHFPVDLECSAEHVTEISVKLPSNRADKKIVAGEFTEVCRRSTFFG